MSNFCCPIAQRNTLTHTFLDRRTPKPFLVESGRVEIMALCLMLLLLLMMVRHPLMVLQPLMVVVVERGVLVAAATAAASTARPSVHTGGIKFAVHRFASSAAAASGGDQLRGDHVQDIVQEDITPGRSRKFASHNRGSLEVR